MTFPSRLSFFTAYSIPRLDYKRPRKEKRPPPYRVPGPDGRASPLDDMPLIPAPTPAASLAGASCGRPPELSSSTLGGPQRPKPPAVAETTVNGALTKLLTDLGNFVTHPMTSTGADVPITLLNLTLPVSVILADVYAQSPNLAADNATLLGIANTLGHGFHVL